MSASVIDRAVFEDLRNTVGTEYISELVGAFLEEAPVVIAALQPARNAGNVELFRRSAHSIKFNAATFGAIHLFELAREKRLSETGSKLQAHDDAFARAASELQELCT